MTRTTQIETRHSTPKKLNSTKAIAKPAKSLNVTPKSKTPKKKPANSSATSSPKVAKKSCKSNTKTVKKTESPKVVAEDPLPTCDNCKREVCYKAYYIAENPAEFPDIIGPIGEQPKDEHGIPELKHQRGIFRIHRNAKETNCRGREITRVQEFIKHSETKIAILTQQIKEIMALPFE